MSCFGSSPTRETPMTSAPDVDSCASAFCWGVLPGSVLAHAFADSSAGPVKAASRAASPVGDVSASAATAALSVVSAVDATAVAATAGVGVDSAPSSALPVQALSTARVASAATSARRRMGGGA